MRSSRWGFRSICTDVLTPFLLVLTSGVLWILTPSAGRYLPTTAMIGIIQQMITVSVNTGLLALGWKLVCALRWKAARRSKGAKIGGLLGPTGQQNVLRSLKNSSSFLERILLLWLLSTTFFRLLQNIGGRPEVYLAGTETLLNGQGQIVSSDQEQVIYAQSYDRFPFLVQPLNMAEKQRQGQAAMKSLWYNPAVLAMTGSPSDFTSPDIVNSDTVAAVTMEATLLTYFDANASYPGIVSYFDALPNVQNLSDSTSNVAVQLFWFNSNSDEDDLSPSTIALCSQWGSEASDWSCARADYISTQVEVYYGTTYFETYLGDVELRSDVRGMVIKDLGLPRAFNPSSIDASSFDQFGSNTETEASYTVSNLFVFLVANTVLETLAADDDAPGVDQRPAIVGQLRPTAALSELGSLIYIAASVFTGLVLAIWLLCTNAQEARKEAGLLTLFRANSRMVWDLQEWCRGTKLSDSAGTRVGLRMDPDGEWRLHLVDETFQQRPYEPAQASLIRGSPEKFFTLETLNYRQSL